MVHNVKICGDLVKRKLNNFKQEKTSAYSSSASISKKMLHCAQIGTYAANIKYLQFSCMSFCLLIELFDKLFSGLVKKAIEIPAMFPKFLKTDKNGPLCADMPQSCTYVCMYMSFCWPIELLDKWLVLFQFGKRKPLKFPQFSQFLKTVKNAPLCPDMPQSCMYVCT